MQAVFRGFGLCLAGVLLLVQGAVAAGHQIDGDLVLNQPPGWRISQQEISPHRPGELHHGIIHYTDGTQKIVLAYFVCSSDPAAWALQRKIYSARDHLARVSIKRVTKSGPLELVEYVMRRRRRNGASRRIVGIWFRRGAAEGGITASLEGEKVPASVERAFASFRADLLKPSAGRPK